MWVHVLGDLASELHQIKQSFVDHGLCALFQTSRTTCAEAFELLGQVVDFEVGRFHACWAAEE